MRPTSSIPVFRRLARPTSGPPFAIRRVTGEWDVVRDKGYHSPKTHLAGPFDTKQEAEEWIVTNSPAT